MPSTTAWQRGKPLSQYPVEQFPVRCIGESLKRYLYTTDAQGPKRLRPDRYEFLVYRLLRDRLEAGDIFCRESLRFRSFDDLPADVYRREQPRFQGANFQRNLDLVARVEEMAREKQCTPAQLALAWLLAQGTDIVPIPGTKRRAYLEQNAGALDVELTAHDLHRLDDVAPLGVAAGARYPEAGMRTVDG